MDAFYGEIRAFPYTYVPQNWLPCDGKVYALSTYPSLRILCIVLGNTYGGDGVTSFGVPNLQGFAAIGAGTGPDSVDYEMGDSVGEDSVTLLANEMPEHTHTMQSQSSPGRGGPSSQALIGSLIIPPNTYPSFADNGDLVDMDPDVVGQTGGGGAHDNHQPYMLLRYCICANGIFPPHP